jgi:hypothetical protein
MMVVAPFMLLQVYASQPLNSKWRYDGGVVATLDNAEFVIGANQFIVHQFASTLSHTASRR